MFWTQLIWKIPIEAMHFLSRWFESEDNLVTFHIFVPDKRIHAITNEMCHSFDFAKAT